MSETALAVVSTDKKDGALALMRQASDVAGVCREIVMRTVMELQGKKYVKVEGWMSIAAAYGCVPTIVSVEEEEGRGVKAVAQLRRHDGTVLAQAEGYVGLDEPSWANRPMYARRGMAQTRAVSRVCRSVFAFVVTLIDSNLQTTPAEEIPQAGEVIDAAPRVVQGQAPRPAAAANSNVERSNRTRVRYGRDKGKHLCDIDQSGLDWQRGAAQKAVAANDPTWGNANKAWLDAIEEEIRRRNS